MELSFHIQYILFGINPLRCIISFSRGSYKIFQVCTEQSLENCFVFHLSLFFLNDAPLVMTTAWWHDWKSVWVTEHSPKGRQHFSKSKEVNLNWCLFLIWLSFLHMWYDNIIVCILLWTFLCYSHYSHWLLPLNSEKNVGMNVKKANKYDFLSLDFGWNMAYG